MVHRVFGLALARARRARDDESGVVLVFTALILSSMMALAALVVDLGNARQQDRQAEAAADAAALAGAQIIENLGATFTGSTGEWLDVVEQVKAYSHANFGVDLSSWEGCADADALPFHPDASNGNSCISADFQLWPAALEGEISLSNRVRVQVPSKEIETGFGKTLDQDSLSVSATATAAVVRSRQEITTTVHEEVAGGPCALCVLSPTETSLDGQNGDITVTGGNVIVNSTAGTAASLHTNGHVRITGPGAIGGPLAPTNFSGSGYSPGPVHLDPVVDPIAHVPACGTGSTCPTNSGSGGSTLNPGIYSSISGTKTLNPGIYILKGAITLNGNDKLTGEGVMIYFACSSYPTPCNSSGQAGARINATGNGSIRVTPPTEEQCETQVSVCPYVGLSIFADRNNTATQTYRGNGTNENGLTDGGAGTFYLKRGTLDLRGNGYTLASMIIANFVTMQGNPSGITIAYDMDRNVPTTHTVTETTTTVGFSYDAGGLVG